MRKVRLPESLVEHARAFTSGAQTPAEPRLAATVVLMRPSTSEPSAGPDVYLLKRQTSMAFAAGMCVFPGGGVDRRDFDSAVAWAGPGPAEWAERMGVDEPTARALVCAAVRETFEESGVLLAGTADAVVRDTTGAEWEQDRAALESRELSFTEFLTRRDLVLRSDLLRVWAGWQTPIFEPRRYRTWFFVALLPEGQLTRDVSTESDSVLWLPASSAVWRVEAGELYMLPPTWLTCLEVGQYAGPADVLAAADARDLEMFTPAVERDGDGFVLSAPSRFDDYLAKG